MTQFDLSVRSQRDQFRHVTDADFVAWLLDWKGAIRDTQFDELFDELWDPNRYPTNDPDRARRIAKDTLFDVERYVHQKLRNVVPEYGRALDAGVKDDSYSTAEGIIQSYSGEGIITMPTGERWRAVGHVPTTTEHGYIEFVTLT